VKAAVSVPVFANGNILFHSDIAACLAYTGADAIMSAEGQLYNAALFTPADPRSPSFDTGLHLPHADLALEYLSIVKGLKTRTSLSAVKGHLFKLMRPALMKELDLRDRLGKIRSVDGGVDEYVELVKEMKRRMDVSLKTSSLVSCFRLILSSRSLKRDAKEAEGLSVDELVHIDPGTGLKVLPHWLAQPYFRPIPKDNGK
jgi:tRNA-dihydrouridine synthase 1